MDSMRIVYLAHPNCVCIQNWATELQKRGHKVLFLTIFPLIDHFDIPSQYIKLRLKRGYPKFLINRSKIESVLKKFPQYAIERPCPVDYEKVAEKLSSAVITAKSILK